MPKPNPTMDFSQWGGPSADQIVHIHQETDAAIGSNGQRLDHYIDSEQSIDARPLVEDDWNDDLQQDLVDTEFIDSHAQGGLNAADTSEVQQLARDAARERTQAISEMADESDAVFEIGDVTDDDYGDDVYGDGAPETPEPEMLHGSTTTRMSDLQVLPGPDESSVDVSEWAEQEFGESSPDVSDWARDEFGEGQDVPLNRVDLDAARPGLQDAEFAGMPAMKPWYQRWFRSGNNHEVGVESELMPLRHQPSSDELTGDISADARGAFNDLIENAAESGVQPEDMVSELGLAASESGWWISKATLSSYITKQVKGGVISAVLVAPLISWMNSKLDGTGDMLGLGMVAVDLLTTGDPLGVLLYAGAQIYQVAANSRQRVLANDHPEQSYGERVGYVREGDTWYPAISQRRFKSTGLLAGDQEVTMQYGRDLAWTLDGEGRMRPVLIDAKTRAFPMLDWEYDQKVMGGGANTAALSSKEFVDSTYQSWDGTGRLGDVTRDWYFLSPEDRGKLLSGELQMQAYTDDITTYDPARQQVNDWRKALDVSEDYKWSTVVHALGDGATVNEYEGNREMSRIAFESKRVGGSIQTVGGTYGDYIQGAAAGKGQGENGTMDMYGDFMYDTVLKDHLRALYRTQQEAAEEAGFLKTFTNEKGDHFQTDGNITEEMMDEVRANLGWGVSVSFAPHHEPRQASGQEFGYTAGSMYQDTSKDLPTALNAEELEQQLHTIEMYDDRTSKQKNYLVQKAQTRYWMQQIMNTGQASQLVNNLYGRGSFDDYDPKGYREMTQRGLNEKAFLENASSFEQNTYQRHFLNEVPGWVAPWQNKDEGLLPTPIGDERWEYGRDAGALMDDETAKQYRRMSEEAARSADEWVRATGNVDPNLLIDGVHWTPTGPGQGQDVIPDMFSGDPESGHYVTPDDPAFREALANGWTEWSDEDYNPDSD